MGLFFFSLFGTHTEEHADNTHFSPHADIHTCTPTHAIYKGGLSNGDDNPFQGSESRRGRAIQQNERDVR